MKVIKVNIGTVLLATKLKMSFRLGLGPVLVTDAFTALAVNARTCST